MAPTWPVSIKGVVLADHRILLARNDRDEWELPGGRLEYDESPEECVVREIAEETGLRVRAGPVVRTWVFEVVADRQVLVVAYGCTLVRGSDRMRVSGEHTAVEFVPLAQLDRLPLPIGYRLAIGDWAGNYS
ncbi:NUDIX domain-containing protein [uncultured Jatrophihabitans sp.]|uniref:NUDIX hydrolase n=1 Tax=uncultured Jatrophihabitans sp. TaxID=1610747 RepID=UPI0035CA7533